MAELDPTIMDLLLGDDPRAQAQAMSDRLRRQRLIGQMGIAGGRRSQAIGASDVADVKQQQDELAKAGVARLHYGEEAKNREAVLKQAMAQLAATGGMDRAKMKGIFDLEKARIDAQAKIDAARIGAERSGVAKEKNLENNVQKLGNDLNFLAQMPESLRTLQWAAKSGRPGVGPVVGRFPDWALSAEGNKVRQAGGKLINSIIYMSTGKQINEEEARRIYESRGIHKAASKEAYEEGVKGLETEIKNAYKHFKSKYSPEVLQIYRERGGLEPFKDIEEGGSTETTDVGDPAEEYLKRVK